jgi:hypothetical protein
LTLFREGKIGEEELLSRLVPEEEHSSEGPGRGSHRARIAELLDAYRAAEQSGAETLRAWAESSADVELKGALRVIAGREAAHAELLAQRVRELGREPSAAIPGWLARYNETLLDERRSDSERIGSIVARFPDVGAATAGLRAVIEQITEDALTRELLRTIADEEELTLRWFHDAHARRTRER